ncbi:MAG: hypothetical protein J1F35_03175 [Erysipelotrichales bacterium]|nr:hypothetical protein [Erysipelotrichales bacterium]
MEQLDKKLNQMSVLEKADKLASLIAKADLETDYAIQVAWGDSAAAAKNAAKIVIENTKTLFQSNRIDQLDPDVRAKTFADYHVTLDSYLKMFPEYQLEDVITETVDKAHSI